MSLYLGRRLPYACFPLVLVLLASGTSDGANFFHFRLWRFQSSTFQWLTTVVGSFFALELLYRLVHEQVPVCSEQ